MSSRYAALSLVALCVIFVLVLKNYETWTGSIEIPPEKSPVKKQEVKVENPPPIRPQKIAGITPPDATVIAGKNIFSPDRKDFPVQSSELRKIVRPQMVLYGVTIGDQYQFASVVNPGRPLLRGERETMSLKIGDKVGDYKLAKVLPDRIVMEAGEDSFEVLLHDAKAPKKRTQVRTETKPAAVASTAAPAPEVPKTTPPAVATPGPIPTPPAVATRPVPSTTAPAPVPRPVIPTRRGRMMYYPGARTPGQPAVPTPPGSPGTTPVPAAPAPQPETEEN